MSIPKFNLSTKIIENDISDFEKIQEYINDETNQFKLVSVAIANLLQDEFMFCVINEALLARMKYREEQLFDVYLRNKDG